MNKYFSIILLILLFSCSKDETVNKFPYDADYKVVSLTSNIPVDLNFDGIYSTDFLNEFSYEFNWDNKYHMRIITPEDYHTILFFEMPFMKRYPPEYNILETTVLDGGATVDYSYSLETNTFTNITPSEEILRQKDISGVVLLDLIPIDENNLLVKFEHSKIYDEGSQQWLTVNVDGIYKKK